MVDPALLNWTISQFLTVIIIMIRVGPLLFFMPVIGSTSVPSQVKILVTVAIAMILAPTVPVNISSLPETTLGFAIFVLSEICFAGTLAVFARMIFAAVQVAGQMVGIQMGMGMAGVMDPQSGTQVSMIGQFWYIIAILIFLSINGHHIFFRTLADSYSWVRPGTLILSQASYEGMMQGVSHMFVLSVKIMAPASAAVFFSHVAMGIIAKTVPQIPILIVGMPLNIGVGLIFVGLSLAYFFPLMLTQFEMLGRLLPRLAMGLGG
ncbi:MAG: flagellar biosynthetic protein FliR [Desulfobulbaceae bacterium]|uniref:Flagellar biosynthetic protein FliR n=1 Tax=Candidatus Desulfobia pelagia TaxID=2841692 RepID=A0A8J6NCJ5_9BACT|nr:flagellar biosynthetic protein FliR [Candidatus Desulfobia pelagia]